MKFLSLDLEMNQPSNRIIQIGAAIGDYETQEILDTFSVHINPYETLNPDIIKLTNITQAQVDAGVHIAVGYDRFVEFYRKYDDVFTNIVVWGSGDTEHLRRSLPGVTWVFGRRWLDIKTMYIAYRLAKGLNIQGGLARTMTKIGLKFEGTKHDACDDATNTLRLFFHTKDLFK